MSGGHLFVGLPVNAKRTDADKIRADLEEQCPGVDVHVIVGATSLAYVPSGNSTAAKRSAAK